MLFERCFKERIWAPILYQLSTASKGGGYRTSTALRIHPFQHPQWKKGGLRQNESPKEGGPSHSTPDPAVASTNTRNTLHPTQWSSNPHSHESLFRRPFSLKGYPTCPDCSAGVAAPVRRPSSASPEPQTPLPSPFRGGPGATPSRRRPLLPTAGGGRSELEGGGALPPTGPAHPPRTDPLKKTPVSGGGRSEGLLC